MTWIEILFAQGVATFEAFTGEISKGDVVRPAIPPLLAARFHRAIEEARGLAEQQLAQADDADAHYQIGATAVLSALRSRACNTRASRFYVRVIAFEYLPSASGLLTSPGSLWIRATA